MRDAISRTILWSRGFWTECAAFVEFREDQIARSSAHSEYLVPWGRGPGKVIDNKMKRAFLGDTLKDT